MRPTAADLRAARYALYDAGVAPDIDGGDVPVLPHALPREDTDGIATLVVSEDARRVLEVGIGIGVGTLAICQARLELGGEGEHVVVDPFAFGNDVAVRTLRDAGAEAMVTRLREASQVALPRMVADNDQFDLALIDGGHRFDEVFLDLVYADLLVRPNGLIVTDDLWLPAIRMAVSYLERNLGYEVEPDAFPGAYRHRRSIFPARRWAGRVAVLRKPQHRRERDWDDYQGFVG
jgi:predicted O-methyltransferase YrrM